MAQSTMYPAMAGSPKTALSSLLSAVATTAYVDNLEKLPAAPNQVTFWITEDTWERCIYSAKSASSGPGTITIARSGTGHASSASNAGLEWPAGTKVARNPSELDHSLFKANIEDLETNKITASGVTYENLAANSDIGTGATQVSQGNHTHTPASLGAASGSTTTKTLYVYGDATGTGDGSTKANGFTTLAACLAAMPDMINHAYVIKMCAAAAPYAATTVQKTVGAGSITIEGEFYKNGTVASAGSTVGKFNTQSGDTGVLTGDRVFLLKYSGTVGSSTPEAGFIDTVAGVSGTEITLTDNTSIAFDTTWTYSIVRTECVSITVNQSNNVTVRGLFINTSDTNGLYFSNCALPRAYNLIVQASGSNGIRIMDCISDTSVQFWDSIAIKNTSTTANRRCVITSDSAAQFRKSLFEGTSSTMATYGGICNLTRGGISIQYSIIRDYGTGTGYGVVVPNGGFVGLTNCLLDGVSESYKMGIALQAVNGAKINCTSVTFGSYITTQKSPANWAATTDGSYIS